MWENGFIRKLRLISKFMKSQTGTQTITVNILPDISSCKLMKLIIWSANRIQGEKYFSSKIMQKMREGD